MDLLAKKITEIDLAFAKEYLKVDYEDEDTIIYSLVVAARSFVETQLGYKITDEFPTTEDIPAELTVACLMIIAHWFDNRQIQQVGTLGKEIGFAVTAILAAHARPFKTEYTDDEGIVHLV